MERWVCKFGGTSLANASQIKRVKEIVDQSDNRVFIVVSAPGKEDNNDIKITDHFLNCHSLIERGEPFDPVFSIIRHRILTIAKELKIDVASIERELDVIYKNLPSQKRSDYAASRGEYLNALMIASYFGATFVDSIQFLSLTKEGRVDPISYERGKEILLPIEGKVVIPGFYGVGHDGSVKTFSRGGSDITGSIVARAVGAHLYENWTDVSGIYVADPRISSKAYPIKSLSYKEVRELATVGATVFHEDAIEPVREVGIPIQIKNTNAPQQRGSLITKTRELTSNPIVGVSSKSPYRKIVIEKMVLSREKEVVNALFNVIDTEGLTYDLRIDAIDTITLFVSTKLSDQEAQRVKSLLSIEHTEVSVGQEIALVGVVGEGLKNLKEFSSTLLQKIKQRVAEVELLDGVFSTKTLFLIPIHQSNWVIETIVEAIIEL